MPYRRGKFETRLNRIQIENTKKKLEREHDCKVWVTAERELIPVKLMSVRHMVACIRVVYYRMLARKLILEQVDKVNADGLDYEVVFLSQNAYDTYKTSREWLYAFYDELERRKITHKRYDLPNIYPRRWHIREELF